MKDKAGNHRDAAGRHEEAAQSHDRASRFWNDREDQARADLQRELAEHERRGAELELRWAELVDPETAEKARTSARVLRRRTREDAERLVGRLTRMADSLDQAAGIVEEHAERHARAGRHDDAATEREAVKRARGAAQRARSQAEQWREVSGERAN
jgi:hypothetical protein